MNGICITSYIQYIKQEYHIFFWNLIHNILEMVFFSCDKCAEMLKKSKVDSHAYRCGCDSVSCVDCSVSFWGGEFVVAITSLDDRPNPMI